MFIIVRYWFELPYSKTEILRKMENKKWLTHEEYEFYRLNLTKE